MPKCARKVMRLRNTCLGGHNALGGRDLSPLGCYAPLVVSVVRLWWLLAIGSAAQIRRSPPAGLDTGLPWAVIAAPRFRGLVLAVVRSVVPARPGGDARCGTRSHRSGRD